MRLTVLHVTDDLELSGVPQVVRLLSEAQTAFADVTVAALRGGRLAAEFHPHVRQVIYGPQGFQEVFALRRLIRDIRPDVIHVHQRRRALVANAARLGVSHAPLIEHVHNSFRDRRLLSFRGDRLLTAGSEITRDLVDIYRRRPEVIDTVYNGVPDPGVVREAPDADVLRLVTVGRLDRQKDPLFWCHVLAELAVLGVPFFAEWIGDGPLRSCVERTLDDLNLGEHVALRGWQPHPAKYVASAHFLVLTSRWEGLPLVILEALAAGVPVIARKVGSVGDAIDRNCGIIVPAEASAREFGAAIAASWDTDRIQAMGLAARERYERMFTLGAFAGRVAKAYEKAGIA